MQSNFKIKYLYNTQVSGDIRRGIELTNDRGEKVVIDFKASELSDIRKFKERILREGDFWFYGSSTEYRDMILELSSVKAKNIIVFPKAGIHNYQGFPLFVSNNVSFYRGMTAKIEGDVYSLGDKSWKLSPSIVTKVSLPDIISKIDYEISLLELVKRWKSALNKNDDGLIALAFLRASLYATPIIEELGFFPFLLVTGEKGSGKNFFCKILMKTLGIETNGDGITNSTQAGIMRKSQQFLDLPYWLDEYSDSKDSGKKIEGILRSAFNRSPFTKSDLDSSSEIKSTICTSTFILSGESLSSDIATRERFVTIFLSREKQNLKGKNELMAHYEDLNKIGYFWIKQRTVQDDAKKAIEGIKKEIIHLSKKYKDYDSRLITIYAILSYFMARICFDIKLDSLNIDKIIDQFITSESSIKAGASHSIKFWEDFINLKRSGVLINGRHYYLGGNFKLGIHFSSVQSEILQVRSRERIEQRIEGDTLKKYLLEEFQGIVENVTPTVGGQRQKTFRGINFPLGKLPQFVRDEFLEVEEVASIIY